MFSTGNGGEQKMIELEMRLGGPIEIVSVMQTFTAVDSF